MQPKTARAFAIFQRQSRGVTVLFSFSSLQVFPLFAGFYAAYAYGCSDKQVRISAQVLGRWAAADGVHGGKGRTDFVTSKALGRRKIPPGDRRADSGAG